MFDLSFSEFILIALVGLICIGPKELPGILRTVGRVVGNIKRQVNHFLHDVNYMEEERKKPIVGDDGEVYEAYDVGALHEEEPTHKL